MKIEHATFQASGDPAPSSGFRRQYHPTTLAVKHGISRAEARKVIAAAGTSREKADEIALAKKKRALQTPPENSAGSPSASAENPQTPSDGDRAAGLLW